MNKERVVLFLKKAGERIAGSHQHWYRRLFPQYGSLRRRQLEVRIRREQKRVFLRVGICTVFLVISLGWNLIGTDEAVSATKERMETLRTEGGRLALEYEGSRYTFDLEPVRDSNGTERSEKELLNEARKLVSTQMLNENPDWNHVSGPLRFPSQLENGVSALYETSHPERISAEGLVDGIGAGEGIPVMIRVTLLVGAAEEQYSLECTVVPPKNPKEAEQALQLRAKYLEEAIGNRSAEEMEDAAWAPDGITVLIPEREEHGWILTAMIAGLMGSIVAGRYTAVEKEREQRKRKLMEELPLLMDQLILMMNAGLILSEALELASVFGEEEDRILSRDLRFLCQRAEETKRPLTSLFCEYAAETGCSELVRFSTMISDHVARGSSALIQQVKMERNYAMENRWKQKEEQYRKMEVQLSGPLFLLLGVILLLTIGPVMIGM